ncbi:MAG TPA: malectin domain-containing carbohydrate-binding protein [Candidatus Sulfopaludibacter sp.]|nr:malectin domain-containing carbohydrate-binding protein [Candidatus Sulfopaludibacter sp.]
MSESPIDVSTQEATAELQAVLASAGFLRSPRLSRLLNYLCTKYLAGEADRIKEYSIGVEVLDRPASFDPANDASARVEVHRLRRRLQQYSDGEGASRKLRLVIPVGHYVPAFVPNFAEEADAATPPTAERQSAPDVPLGLVADILAREPAVDRRGWKLGRVAPAVAVLVLLFAGYLAYSQFSRKGRPRAAPLRGITPAAMAAVAPRQPAIPLAPPGNAVRVACGHTVSYTDRSGQTWSADRYFEGGWAFDTPRQFITRAFDPRLFQKGRTGDFSYHIPLGKGVYELHLGFVETSFGPGTPAGSGEYARVFDVKANGRTLLEDFDIYSDAGGNNIADVRVFKDISPGADGLLHLEFHAKRTVPLVNTIELVPARAHRLNPIRLVAQENFVTGANGVVWSPDTYVSGGQLAAHSVELGGTEDPDLYARERYGHFEYAIPVDSGVYGLSLHFAEEYFGSGNDGGGGVGRRLFDVFCNGVALLRSFDIFREAGTNRALVKTFHGLTPNAQGKLVVMFLPVKNYASLYALEVVDETQ